MSPTSSPPSLFLPCRCHFKLLFTIFSVISSTPDFLITSFHIVLTTSFTIRAMSSKHLLTSVIHNESTSFSSLLFTNVHHLKNCFILYNVYNHIFLSLDFMSDHLSVIFCHHMSIPARHYSNYTSYLRQQTFAHTE